MNFLWSIILFSGITLIVSTTALCADEQLYCLGCHTRKAEKTYSHKPVKDGNCTLCHKSTDKPHPRIKKGAFTLTDSGKSKLCYECHKAKNTLKFVHSPVASGDCLECHDAHQSEHKGQLKVVAEKLCFECHDKKKLDRTYPHPPIAEGKCTGCHDPHQSKNKFMLKDEGVQLCYRCHDKRKFMGTAVHPPVAEGDCIACHSTHGTDNPHLLKEYFPDEFYMPFNKSNFKLCFTCHNNKLADDPMTETTTRFRNGMTNIHFIHVNKDDKGRSCKTCHDPHASSQGHLISGRIQNFGLWKIPIRYSKTNTGGTCVVGCHKPKSYDRFNAVTNK